MMANSTFQYCAGCDGYDCDEDKGCSYPDLRPVVAPQQPAPSRVRTLDLSTILRHAFLSGVVAARNVPACEACVGPELWPHYEPYEPGSYSRVTAALSEKTTQTSDTRGADAFRNMFAILHNLETSDLSFMDAEQRRTFFNDPCVAILRLDDARLDALYALVQSKQPARYREVA